MYEVDSNEDLYDEDKLYDKAVGAGVIAAIIALVFSVVGSIAMAVTTTQSMGFSGLLYTIIAIIPSTLLITVVFFVVAGGLVYGRKFLTPIFNFIGFFLYLPIVGWLIFHAIKLVISICIGWVFFVYQFIVRLIDKIQMRKSNTSK